MAVRNTVEYYHKNEFLFNIVTTGVMPIIPRIGETVALRGYRLKVVDVIYNFEGNTIEVHCVVK